MTKQELFDQIIELQRKKDIDYGSSFAKTYELFGRPVIFIRLHDKLSRYERLSKNEALVGDESIIDTIIDTVCYSVLSSLAIKGKTDFEGEFISMLRLVNPDRGMKDASGILDSMLNDMNNSDFIMTNFLSKLCSYAFQELMTRLEIEE